MGNSFINVNVHLVFHVKSTGCTMREEDLPRVFHYIGGVIGSLSAHPYMVGGCVDHVHILTSLPVTMSLAELVRAVKANSSRWIKGLDAHYNVFSWQEGYGAFSVSESNKVDVINYIVNQQEHHRKYSMQEEFQIFLKKNGITVDEWGCHVVDK